MATFKYICTTCRKIYKEAKSESGRDTKIILRGSCGKHGKTTYDVRKRPNKIL